MPTLAVSNFAGSTKTPGKLSYVGVQLCLQHSATKSALVLVLCLKW